MFYLKINKIANLLICIWKISVARLAKPLFYLVNMFTNIYVDRNDSSNEMRKKLPLHNKLSARAIDY